MPKIPKKKKIYHDESGTVKDAGKSGAGKGAEDDVVAQIDAFVGESDPRLDPTNPENLERIAPTKTKESDAKESDANAMSE